ncbi:MAG: hypothetical protein JXX14_14645, partial [Deltaproteobacteria bacterium]|nr:hypothetical protein [Deltaproteobacteria bacterium]
MHRNITGTLIRIISDRLALSLTLVIAAGIALSGCAPATSGQTPSGKKVVLEAADEPSFEIAGISVLPVATEEKTLPFVATPSFAPAESPCLERSTKSKQWTTANDQVLTTLKRSEKQVSAALLMWLQSELPDDVPTSDLSRWRATPDDQTVMIRHFNTDDVRFTDAQTCITDTVQMLPDDGAVVTTLFGATGFSARSKSPMDPETIKGLKKLAQKKRMRVKPVPTYPRAKDAKGRPAFKKGKALFMAPDGTLVFGK